MQILNPALVIGARALIQSQGGNPLIINSDGSLNPEGAIALLFNNVEVRTSITPPIIFPIGPSGQPSTPESDAITKALKPTIILSGPAGQVMVAPYGTEVAKSWIPIVAAGVGIVALVGWLVFGSNRK